MSEPDATPIDHEAAAFIRSRDRAIAVRDAMIQAVAMEAGSAMDPKWVGLIVKALQLEVCGVEVNVSVAVVNRDGSEEPERLSALAYFADGEIIRIRIDTKAARMLLPPGGGPVCYVLDEDGCIDDAWQDYWVLREPVGG